jgi:hypothetical protein
MQLRYAAERNAADRNILPLCYSLRINQSTGRELEICKGYANDCSRFTLISYFKEYSFLLEEKIYLHSKV